MVASDWSPKLLNKGWTLLTQHYVAIRLRLGCGNKKKANKKGIDQ